MAKHVKNVGTSTRETILLERLGEKGEIKHPKPLDPSRQGRGKNMLSLRSKEAIYLRLQRNRVHSEKMGKVWGEGFKERAKAASGALAVEKEERIRRSRMRTHPQGIRRIRDTAWEKN